MGLLKEKDKQKVTQVLKQMKEDVTLVMFTQEMECPRCEMVRTMLEEISALSEKISLAVYDFVADAEKAKQHGVDKIPATVILGESDYGIRYFGVPGGYEFNALIQDIRDVGNRDPGLSPEVTAELAKIDQPVHLQVITITT